MGICRLDVLKRSFRDIPLPVAPVISSWWARPPTIDPLCLIRNRAEGCLISCPFRSPAGMEVMEARAWLNVFIRALALFPGITLPVLLQKLTSSPFPSCFITAAEKKINPGVGWVESSRPTRPKSFRRASGSRRLDPPYPWIDLLLCRRNSSLSGSTDEDNTEPR